MAEIAVELATSAGELLLGELSLVVGVRREIQYVIKELKILSGFLRDAEEKQVSNEAARAWVKEVREIAYDVEDCLDDFYLHIEHEDFLDDFYLHIEHRHGGNHFISFVRLVCSFQYFILLARLVCPYQYLIARHRIATQIKDIKSKVEEVSKRGKRYGIITNAPSRTEDYADTYIRRYDPRMSALFVEDSQLVGIDGPRKKLVGWLLDETKFQLSLMAVVGEGGLGKTTIVKKAYDNPSVTGRRFKCHAWITVSQTYNVDGILRDIIKQVIPTENPNSMERVQLIVKLKDYLEDKSYIIVFDDIWEMDAWKDLEMALPKNELGSRILLTTRKQELAEATCATQNIHGDIYHHKKLTLEESEELFLRRVFNNPGKKTCPEDLKDPTQAILKKCDGLPLAIISIAGVLASKPNKSRQEWEKMLSRLGSELDFNPSLKDVKQILTLSYNDLPYHVRHCFLYLCKFPEDYLIKRKRIQSLWVAEGLVSGRHDMTAEEVAESYFNELVNRFMILPSTFNSLNGKVRYFRVHDIMLELIVSKSREENFLSLVGNNNSWITQDVIRRLSIHDANQYMKQNMSLSHVRSLTMIHEGAMPMFIFPLFGMLRVLDLEDCDTLRNEHLKIVAKLFHLKYLNLRDTHVDELPECVKRLRKLETLDIRGTSIRELPKGIIKLQQLRFLNGDILKIPRGIGRLRALQVLTGINAERSGKQVIKELGKITQLQKLAVRELPEDWMKDFCDSLTAMTRSLRSLYVEGTLLENRRGSLDGLNDLCDPPLLLESLRLVGELKQLPTWVLSLTNLLKIRLSNSGLDEDAIQSLGTLPNLLLLELFYFTFEGGRLCFGDQGFPRLKELRIHWCRNLKSVIFQGGVMGQLECLSITLYPGDHMMRIVGITNLPSLKELRTNKKIDEDMEEVKAQLDQHPNRPTLIKVW